MLHDAGSVFRWIGSPVHLCVATANEWYMPHQCTSCDHLFDDGSKEMLSGCPDCGGNKFQFRPADWSPDDDSSEEAVESAESNQNDSTQRESRESPAQADARSSIVSPSDLKSVSSWPGEDEQAMSDGNDIIVGEPAESDGQADESVESEGSEMVDEGRLGLDDLREELNEQFESIKILAPGEYELNLMELYEREEYIIALQEDGRYMIEVPNYWSEDD